MEHNWYSVKDIENQIEEIHIPVGIPLKFINEPKHQTYLPPPVGLILNWITKYSKTISI